MGKSTNEERDFTLNIDRLLAGEEVESTEDASDDHRTALNFARKLTESRVDPSPVFKAHLKEQLLLKLAQEEAKAAQQRERAFSFWEFLKNLVPQSPTWRTATVTIVMVLIAVSVLWRTGMFTRTPLVEVVEDLAVEEAPAIERTVPVPAPEMPAAPPGMLMEEALSLLPLELTILQSQPAVYSSGETIELDLIFRNIGSEPITISSFPPAIHIIHSDSLTPVRSFTEGEESLELAPSEAVNYTLVWSQENNSGEQVILGWYSVHVGDVTILTDTEPSETQQSFGPVINLLIQ